MLHHHYLVAFSVVGVKFKTIIEQRPFLLVKDLLGLLDLNSSGLLLFFLFDFIIFFLFFFLLVDRGSKNQRLDDSSIDYIFIAIKFIVEFGLSFFQLFLLGLSQVKDQL